MLQEIREQPVALARTLKSELAAIVKLRKYLETHRPRLVVLAARGTSDNAAQFGRYLIEISTGIPVSLAAPSVHTLYRAPVNMADTLVIGVSQSGESTDVNFVLERAKEQGAFTIGVTNESESTLARLADQTIQVRAGKEKSVAATKTYTGQLLAMYLIAWALGADLKLKDLEKLPDLAAKALTLEKQVAERCVRYHYMERAVVVGRGLNYANAFEMALKLMETCYVVAERFSSADLLHGPIAMVERTFPAFLFAPSGVTWTAVSETLTKLQSLHAETFVISDKSNKEVSKPDLQLPMKLNELYTPIPYIIPAQLFAAHLAAEKGLNPDQPRALSKVTQNI
ncbi:MAG: SIS domain-containing protein [Acidobacteria bacterium]|nr:SIS domain-containing protein [Acidobacteriota bacterium]